MTLRMISEKEHDGLEKKYKYRRIRCVQMPKDPLPIPKGTMGYCYGIDGAGHLMMYWDNGQSLNLIPGVDEFAVIRDRH